MLDQDAEAGRIPLTLQLNCYVCTRNVLSPRIDCTKCDVGEIRRIAGGKGGGSPCARRESDRAGERREEGEDSGDMHAGDL